MTSHSHKKAAASFKVEQKSHGALCKEFPQGATEDPAASTVAYLEAMLADGWELVSAVETMWIFKAVK